MGVPESTCAAARIHAAGRRLDESDTSRYRTRTASSLANRPLCAYSGRILEREEFVQAIRYDDEVPHSLPLTGADRSKSPSPSGEFPEIQYPIDRVALTHYVHSLRTRAHARTNTSITSRSSIAPPTNESVFELTAASRSPTVEIATLRNRGLESHGLVDRRRLQTKSVQRENYYKVIDTYSQYRGHGARGSCPRGFECETNAEKTERGT